MRQVKRPLRRTCLPPSPFAPESAFDAEYDAQFEHVVKAFVYMDGDKKVIRPISGVKD